jgi:chromosome segregation ATPase
MKQLMSKLEKTNGDLKKVKLRGEARTCCCRAHCLHSQLSRLSCALKQMSGINKKALDQYASFTEERNSLQKRRQGPPRALLLDM